MKQKRFTGSDVIMGTIMAVVTGLVALGQHLYETAQRREQIHEECMAVGTEIVQGMLAASQTTNEDLPEEEES